VNQLQDDEISEEDKRAACSYVLGFHAAHPDEITVQSIIEGMQAEEKIDGDSQFRLPEGYDHLVDALRRKLQPERARVQLNTEVKAVRWKSGSAEVHATDAEGRATQFQSRKLLVTLPLGLLVANGREDLAVRFDPPLTTKSDVLAKLRVGHVIRVSIVFRRRFWAEMKVDGRSLAKMTFLFSQDQVFPTWWTFAPTEAPLLTAWAPADAAERLSELSDAEICEQAVQALARVFHMPVPWCREEIVQAYTHNWQKDPHSRGAYSYIAEGGGDTIREFAAPLQNTLFFAGEATNFVGHHATVHGAIASGYRAAEEILKTK
jgi:monoamine oxidase